MCLQTFDMVGLLEKLLFLVGVRPIHGDELVTTVQVNVACEPTGIPLGATSASTGKTSNAVADTLALAHF